MSMNDTSLNQTLKEKVTERSADPSFRHHQWFVTYHLEIVEKIARELRERYPDADWQTVEALVWLHDYEKIIDFDDQYNTDLVATRQLMQEVGFAPDAVEAMATQINLYNAKQDLAAAPIETQIVSSSDAASHLVGPFVTLYWYENPDKSIEQLQADNQAKLDKDWDKKVTLPEVKQAFETRRRQVMEIAGQLPERYL
jgi:hypothetical protein